MLRPILRAAPVTSATRPSKGNSATAGLPAPSGRDHSGHPAPEPTTPPAPVNRAFDAVGAAAYNQAPSVRRSGGAMKLDLLAIAAHPDDVELTCGGTLIKMVENGYKVGILDLTEGEMGTRGTVEIRRREAAAASRILGVTLRENLGLPDARLEVNEEYKLAVARKIRALRPRTVILPYWEGRHPDHYNAGKLAYEGCFLAGKATLIGELACVRSEEHTSELQSQSNLVCRLLLEKKNS